MWVEILCGLVAYKIIRRVFFADDGDPSYLADLDSSHSDLCFAVAARPEKLYAGRCFVGLRIPDADAGARLHIDVVLVTKRLEIKGDKNLLGEFIEFKGRHDDIQLLKNLKRSKVSRFIIQKSTLFGGFGRSRVQILYSPRDCRAEGTSSSEWKEISVKQYTEILFQPLHSKKVKKFKLSSVVSVTLST